MHYLVVFGGGVEPMGGALTITQSEPYMDAHTIRPCHKSVSSAFFLDRHQPTQHKTHDAGLMVPFKPPSSPGSHLFNVSTFLHVRS